jgi:hypothetical protein
MQSPFQSVSLPDPSIYNVCCMFWKQTGMIFYVFLSVVHDVPLNCLAALTPLLTEAYEESFKQRIQVLTIRTGH